MKIPDFLKLSGALIALVQGVLLPVVTGFSPALEYISPDPVALTVAGVMTGAGAAAKIKSLPAEVFGDKRDRKS